MALYAALRLCSLLVRFVPVSVMYALADAGGALAYFLFPIPRRQIQRNLAVVLPDVQPRERVRLARHAFQNDAKNWIDTVRIPQMAPGALVDLVDIEGWDYFQAAMEQKRGLIFATAHVGNFDFVGQVVVAFGYKLTVPVERMKPERLFRFLVQQRASRGINIVPLERGPREMLRAVREGEMVAVTVDRVIGGRGIAVEFFGKPALMARGPAALARHTGAPVLAGAVVRVPNGRYRGYVAPPIEMRRSDDPDADEKENTQRIVATLERFIRDYADQWTAFSPIWTDDTHGNWPANIGHRNEAAV